MFARFILKVDIDKGKSYYSNLISAIRRRDKFIHNKSKDFTKYNKSEDFTNVLDLAEEKYFDTTFEKNKMKEELQWAQEAIRAMRDIASFFDENDYNALAQFKLFGKKKC